MNICHECDYGGDDVYLCEECDYMFCDNHYDDWTKLCMECDEKRVYCKHFGCMTDRRLFECIKCEEKYCYFHYTEQHKICIQCELYCSMCGDEMNAYLTTNLILCPCCTTQMSKIVWQIWHIDELLLDIKRLIIEDLAHLLF